jgi:transcriptional regulator with XRE-family HTH domain
MLFIIKYKNFLLIKKIMAFIGEKLRELRMLRSLTLQQVADSTGFAVSYLSQLERDKVSISVDNLERLANFYEVHMVHFFRGTGESPVLITRRAQIIEQMESAGHGPADVTFLANRADARMEPMLVRIQPGQEEPHFRQHDADTLLYILQGQARLLAESGEAVELSTGDLAYYVNYPRRRIINTDPQNSLLFIVVTAPPTSSLDELINMRQGTGDSTPAE